MCFHLGERLNEACWNSAFVRPSELSGVMVSAWRLFTCLTVMNTHLVFRLWGSQLKNGT